MLGGFRYQDNRAVLHTDRALMPRRRKVWSSWNYLSNGRHDAGNRVSLTYWMNSLQKLETKTDVFVSLNPIREPAAETVVADLLYSHPQFDHTALAAQRDIGDIQGRRRVWFCGAHCGYGFHEDGLASGMAVADALGAPPPWQVVDVSPARRNATPRIELPAEAAE